MTWYCLPLQARVDADAEKAWRTVWSAEYGEASGPATGGIFLLVATKAGEALFFSPEAEDLAEAFGAKPCDKPAPEHLRLAAGAPQAWEHHFPGARQAAGHGEPPAAADSTPSFAPTEPSAQAPLA